VPDFCNKNGTLATKHIKIRLDFYDDGIKRYIMPGDTVVDLGTGTGILSFLAT
jgi:predicted RNA methylase